MADTPDDTPLTRYFWTARTIGSDWLGSEITLEELAIATILEERDEPYWYQAPFGGFRDNLHVDFLILRRVPQLVWEVMGDKYHGPEQADADRIRQAQVESQGAIVVRIFGGQIMAYPGQPIPTWGSLNAIIDRALLGIETPYNWLS